MEFNGTFLASIVSFIVFVFLMNKVLYAPMGKIVKERQSFIEGNLESAEANHKRADELSQERDDKLSGAKNDARSKYVESVNGFKNEKTQIVAKAQDETNSELSQAYENLNNVSNETKEGLKWRMTDLANDIVEKVLGYRSEVQGFDNDKIKVGIKWQGNTYYDQDRVIPTHFFKPLMEVENTQYYSFQTFEGSEDAKELDGIIDIGKDLIDFGQTAAALSNLDLVICNDTSLAHLAGAMGIPCWIILPYEVNWRWHTDLSVCDWYDSVKLFRQHSVGDWQSVFDDILKEMKPE